MTLITLSVQFFIIPDNKIIHICMYVCMYVCIYIILFTINILFIIKFNVQVPTCKKSVLFLDLHKNKRQSMNNWPIQGIEMRIHSYESGVTIYTQNHSILDEILVPYDKRYET